MVCSGPVVSDTLGPCLLVAVYRFESGILLTIPERFCFPVRAKGHRRWIAAAGYVQRAAAAGVAIDALAHAGIDQKEQPVSLEKIVFAALLSVRKLHASGLMALNQVFHPERFYIAGQHGLRVSREAAQVE